MKLLAFVDMHGSNVAFRKIKEVLQKEDIDYIICAGDFTVFGDSQQKLVTKLDTLGKPILMLHGNHEDRDVLKKQCAASKNIIFMDKKILEVPGYTFVGHGGGGFALSDPDFDNWIGKNYKSINKKTKIVFIMHQPPAETILAELVEGGEAGNRSYTKFIKKMKPVLAICGHLHYNAGLEDSIGKTRIVQPGPFGHIYNV